MNCINDPAKAASFFAVGMNPVMAFAAEGGKVFVATEPLSRATSLVMNILAVFIFATLTLWVEGKIRLLCLAILAVFTLALGGCMPQPSAAFQWSF
jgi:hypothetical protein